MGNPLDARNKYYEWTNEVFANLPFDLKYANLISLAVALVQGHAGAIKYFYTSAQKAGATDAELAATLDITNAATGLNLYAQVRDLEKPSER